MAFLLKRVLGIKSTSANWCVLRECAQEFMQFYWFRSAVKFWNRMVDSNSNTLRDVMKADRKQEAEYFYMRIDLRFRHQAVWREAHGQDPCSCLSKKVWLFTTGLLCLDFSSVFFWFGYRLFSKLPLKCPPEAYSDVTLPYLCLRDRFLMHVHHLSCRSIWRWLWAKVSWGT